MNSNRGDSHKLIFQEVKERLHDQFESITTLDTKAGITLALIGTSLGGLVNSSWFINLPYYFLLPVLLSMATTLIYALKEIFADDFRKDPDPSSLIKEYWAETYDKTQDQLISNFEQSYILNLSKISVKKHYLNRSFLFIFITIVLLSIALFFSNNRIIIENIKIG